MPVRKVSGITRRSICRWLMTCASVVVMLPSVAATAGVDIVSARFDDDRLRATDVLVLPQVFLYDASGRQVPFEAWPVGLREVTAAFGGSAKSCKPSDDPTAACEVEPVEMPLDAHFDRLIDADGAVVDRSKVQPRQWLLVDWGADWCAPCQLEEKALQAYFASAPDAGDYSWLLINFDRYAEIKGVRIIKP